jgi:hypothetical protein
VQENNKNRWEHKNVLREMDFELLPNVFFVSLYKIFVISTGASCHGVSFPWGELSVGRVVHGASFYGASCPWVELSMGRVVHRVSCPWGQWSMGRVVYEAN